ncbi:MAG: trypsin-like peptidase domain-containing protein [Saprospiraceae bacterium]|nr:trypsin-like peptidase domain-containing protein [Saprospiraceae bacterium]MBK7809760.1 trypsin-like peptidase domain-containing protein [Saprospiraceae bacterium]MBK9632129.1 trypsin-like peptidase domain-containing protein [Saprospiraceae bacterium]
MDILQQIIQLVTILFLLSMVCERIADFLKHYLSNSHIFQIQKDFFKVGDTLTKSPKDDAKEQARIFRILKINVWSGILLAAILKADLIKIFNNINEPGKTLGWNNISEYGVLDSILLPFGIILTGCFISFGSKFWHDLLDILYQIKNTKRVLADPETYKVDNIKTLQKLFDTYQSDFIKAAYLEAKTKFMAIESVKAIGIKSNELGYYFEITVNRNEPTIDQFYQYLLDDGTPQNIPIKLVVIAENDKIFAHSVDLSGMVFDITQPDKWGTLGVIVKPTDNASNKRYLLTCCHNLVNPIRKIYENDSDKIKTGTIDAATTKEIGIVFKADRDHEMDAALVEIDILDKRIINSVPQMGNPQKSRQLFNRDAGNVTAFIYGAKSGVESQSISKGIVTSIYNSIKVEYDDNPEFVLINTIAISNNGRAISQGGDSGACVLDRDNNVIGLVVAGNSQVTYALPITTLLTKLNVQLI